MQEITQLKQKQFKDLSAKQELINTIRAKKDKLRELNSNIATSKDELYSLEETKAKLSSALAKTKAQNLDGDANMADQIVKKLQKELDEKTRELLDIQNSTTRLKNLESLKGSEGASNSVAGLGK